MPRAKKPTQDVGSSSGKRKPPSKKTSKQPITYDDMKFETEAAWIIYTKDTSQRNIIPQRRVLISDFENELLGQVIARNQWETFVATPRVAYVEIVKEFYANIHDDIDNPDHPKYHQVYMRGQYIPFSPLAILRYYELDNTENDSYQAATSNLDEVVVSIAEEMDHWPVGSSTLHYKCLTPQVRTLDKMVSANLLPTTHTSTVTMERARLLYWLQNKTLNIGTYIFFNVLHIRNNRRCLAFPSLITGLCEMYGIDLSHEVTQVKRTIQIDRMGIRSSELHMTRNLERITQGPIGGQGNVPLQTEPANDDPMAEDLHETVTSPTMASISHEIRHLRTSQVELEAQIREIREAQVQEAESRRREHDALSTQLTQLLGYFSLYPPPPLQ